VRPARKLNDGRVTAEQRFDVGEVLRDRDLVALSFVLLVPMVVIAKDQRDDVEEVLDELIWCRRIDQAMKSAIEVEKIVVAPVYSSQ
jgi:hypothetical protein